VYPLEFIWGGCDRKLVDARIAARREPYQEAVAFFDVSVGEVSLRNVISNIGKDKSFVDDLRWTGYCK
jgi:hypothetical protein